MRSTSILLAAILCGHLPAAPKALPLNRVAVTGGYWQQRLATNVLSTIPYVFRQTDETGHMRNLERAAGTLKTPFEGAAFFDSDLSKIIEAAGYALQTTPDAKLAKYCDDLAKLIAAGQATDGFLGSYFCLPERAKENKWDGIAHMHQTYNMGHFFEAAIALYHYDPKTIAMPTAVKCADMLARTFRPGGLKDPDGHEEIELALVKLYEATQNTNYLKVAKYLLDQRGNTNRASLYGWYSQDDMPLIKQREARGHSVRAAYAYAAMADIARECNDRDYHTAVTALWENVTAKKMYLTGTIGTLFSWEGFDKDYRLPNNTMYGETCAGIANFLWNWRMFRLERDAKYLDVCERLVYNAIPGGIGLEGQSFFYVNVLQSEGERRQPWFGCACCPGNVARFIQSFPGLAYATEGDTVFMNFFLNSEARILVAGTTVTIKQESQYPWHGAINAVLSMGKATNFSLAIRIPGWVHGKPVPTDIYTYVPTSEAATPEIMVNGKAVVAVGDKGFVIITREWQDGDTIALNFPMPIRRVQAHPAVTHDIGKVAFERGPIVFCAEQADNTIDIRRLYVKADAAFSAAYRTNLFGGVMTVEGPAVKVGRGADRISVIETPCTLTLIPYYTRANRAPSRMSVWLAGNVATTLLDPVPTIASDSTVSGQREKNLSALNDQRYPKTSDDNTMGLYCTWPDRGPRYWLQYDFKKAEKVSMVRVFWFDDTGFGAARFPKSWSLLYRKNGAWVPVENTEPYRVVKDDFTTVQFKPVTTDALKLDVVTDDNNAFGILEWEVK